MPKESNITSKTWELERIKEGITETDYYEQTENPQNGYRLQEQHLNTWYLDTKGSAVIDDTIRWGSVYDIELQGSELILTDHDPPSIWELMPTLKKRGKRALPDCISSQLLQYRLTAVFGMLQSSRVSGFARCWELYLIHRRSLSQFHLYDEYGVSTCTFRGTEEASKDALALLNYLCGTNVPHPDPKLGLLAGIRGNQESILRARVKLSASVLGLGGGSSTFWSSTFVPIRASHNTRM